MQVEKNRDAIEALRRRLASTEGFTLIELQIVMVILGILILTFAPSYRAFRDRAAKGAAAANVRNASQAANLYFEDHSTYVGMTTALLLTYNRSLPAVTITHLTATSYCIASTVGIWTAYRGGPSAAIGYTPC